MEMHNNEHIREEEFEEALRSVKEELRKLEDRGFHDAVRRMAEENERLRNLQCKQYSQNSTSLSAGDRARCPKCNGTGKRECGACDGRGEYFGRRGMTSCDICSGTGRVRCRAYTH